MANRVFVSSVVVLWLTSMTWLVTERILPSFFQGQPPVIHSLETGEPVAWQVEWGGEYVGTAASIRVPGAAGTTELHNRMKLDSIPLMELAPTWMRKAVGNLGNMSLDARTRIEFDSLGNFSSFASSISLNEFPSVLKIRGKMEGSNLVLNVRSGDFPYTSSVYLPDRKILNEALFPDARLPSMHVGRRWQEEVYSPFRVPGDPVELVQAEVVSLETLEYWGGLERVMRINYRSGPGSGISQHARLQAVSWVTLEGEVLRRDVFFGDSRLRFDRLTQTDAAEAGAELFRNLTGAKQRRE